jgi:phosphoglycerol transferase MdoB-like AlkP superfamily enzyme
MQRGGPTALYALAVFVLFGLIGVVTAEQDKAEGQSSFRLVQTSPLWKRMANRTLSREEFLKSANALGLGSFDKAQAAVPARTPRNLNVVLVFMESSYNKHLSLFGSDEETQPLLSKYKERMELFPNFFSAFTGSIHARFATFTSLYPILDYASFTEQRVPVKSLFEVLHEQGYSCSMFYSSYFGYTGFGDFLKNRGLDEMYDADSMPGQRNSERVAWGLLEEETLDAMRAQIKKYAQSKQRFCMTYVPAAPHYPYDKIPEAFRKHKMVEVGDFTPVYLNELLYIDWVLASILDQLKESDLLDHTLVIITNDHGEMLGGKDGHIGHGWAVTPELVNTPLIVMDPGNPGAHVNTSIGAQVDLLPTVVDRLGLELPSDQLYEGRSLYSCENRGDRKLYLNSYKQYAIVSTNEMTLGDRESDTEDSQSFKVFAFGNQGTKTVFTPATNSPAEPLSIGQFDKFQESLLRNYALYRASVLRVK